MTIFYTKTSANMFPVCFVWWLMIAKAAKTGNTLQIVITGLFVG
jgi:hypothetical protein